MLGTSSVTAKFPPEYIKQLKETLYQVHEWARVNLQSAQKRQKKDCDLKINQQKYNIGDVVLKINSATKVGQTPKLKQPWKGPYIITKVKSPVLYKIKDRKTESVVHHDRLKMYYFTKLPFWFKRLSNNLLQDTDSNVTLENDDSEDMDDIFDISGLFISSDQYSDTLTSEPNRLLIHDAKGTYLDSDTLTLDQLSYPKELGLNEDQRRRPVIQNMDKLLDHSSDLDHTYIYMMSKKVTQKHLPLVGETETSVTSISCRLRARFGDRIDHMLDYIGNVYIMDEDPDLDIEDYISDKDETEVQKTQTNHINGATLVRK
ncbi:unnamed protein product [Mytilus coruscus]|uniref:Integrase p58-like C-terminal domain-containing protein n=1 Tax=Mytilus coruscus TaxID=42192 RepID=A0A6J8DLM9_MYTCO|nr:unnamed protein product [Mytilus coruscus]